MSWFEVTKLTCPSCGHDFECGTAETLNVSRMPWAKQQILTGSFHRFGCPACGDEIRVNRDFLYSDFEQSRFVQVFTPDAIEQWPDLEVLTESTFHDACKDGSPFVQALPGQFSIRTCFGLEALADKLRLWDAGLDDALVELLKMELLLSQDELRARPHVELMVVDVSLREDVLELEAYDRGGSTEPTWYRAQLARYRELEADRAALIDHFPGLFQRPFRSFRRLVREVAAAAAESP